MLITFKILKARDRNQWLGWFGDDLIKVRLINVEDLQDSLVEFIKQDLGIREEKIKFVNINKNFVTLELPDVAWELLLSAIE